MARAPASQIFEPVAVDGIPARLQALTRAQREAVTGRALGLARELAALVRLVTLKHGTSPLDRLFVKLARSERFHLPLEGIERLSTGLRLPEPSRWKRADPLRDALYVLYRLQIAKTVAQQLTAEGIVCPISLVLTLFRREGGFAVPLGLDDLQLGLVPAPMPAPSWPITEAFLGPHSSFFLEKESPPWLRYGPLIRGVRERVQSREGIVRTARDEASLGSILRWMGASKQAAFTLFLFVLGGLDYMTAGVSWPGADDYADQRLIFRYLYARNRAAVRPELLFADLVQQGEQLFGEVCSIDPAAFRQGRLANEALAMLLTGTGEEQQHFVVPVRASHFTMLLVREAVVALSSMRTIPLWCGGKAFKPALPPTVAYVRYNGGDVNFVIMVLNLLDRVLNGSSSLPSPRLTRNSASRLTQGLADFRRSRNSDVWRILDEWNNGTEDTNYLKSEVVRKGVLWRSSLLEDAKGDFDSLPGKAELRFRDALNLTGHMATALPLLEALTEKQLWPALLELMLAPIGTGRRPWLGHAPNRIGNQIGMNVLRFHYTLRGYEVAFG